MSYLFLQCNDEECRFRFPALAADAKALRCPRCHGDTRVAAEAVHNSPLPAADPMPTNALVALLDNIRSIHNVGSMFRSADGAGLARLHLSGITATPEHPRLAKAALGAHRTVPWTYHRNGVDAAESLKDAGYQLWALERMQSGPALAVSFNTPPPCKLALVVGNERAGVDPGILALCHGILSLPMMGEKSSLNVAVAFGIGIYSLRFGFNISVD